MAALEMSWQSWKQRVSDVLSSLEVDQWVYITHPRDNWNNQPTLLVIEIAFYIFGLLILRHAWKSGGRYPYLWLAAFFHGLTIEGLSYVLGDIDNYWYSQTTVMLFGRRLPLYIVLVYPTFYYTASVAVSRMYLKRWAEPFAVGLALIAFDIPFDIIGLKMLWWSFHDTDPNIFDRTYWVPWTVYYFHASFASSFAIIFHGSRKLLSDKEAFQSDGFLKEFICCLMTGLFSFPLGVLQFIPIYHTLHDNISIHTQVCFLLLLAIYLLVIWTADRHPERDARTIPNKGWFDGLALVLVGYFSLFIGLVFLAKPENIRSLGFHQKTGNCSATSPVLTAFGQVLSKKTFLCVNDYDEGYFDFHCTKPPREGADWYVICGTPYENHLESCVIVTFLCLMGLYVYLQMLAFSGRQPKSRLPRAMTPKAKRS